MVGPFGVSAQGDQEVCQPAVGLGVVGRKLNRALEFVEGFVVVVLLPKQASEIVRGGARKGIISRADW